MPFISGYSNLLTDNSRFPSLDNLVSEDDDNSSRLPTTEPLAKRIRLSRTASVVAGASSPYSSSTSEHAKESKGSIGSKKLIQHLNHVYIPGPAFPPSLFPGWTPSVPIFKEHTAISELKDIWRQQKLHAQSNYTFFELNYFIIYRPPQTKHAGEMTSLDKLLNNRFPSLLVDGVLSIGEAQYFVRGVPFKTLTIDGYLDQSNIGINENICIQSIQGCSWNVWYRLGRPAMLYKRFHDPFVWLAQFTKLFINYLFEHQSVALNHFRQHFFAWLSACYINPDRNEEVALWLSQIPFRDFRTTVNANLAFLYKECYGIDDETSQLIHHPIWEEIDPHRLQAIPRQMPVEHKTIVTPFAYECFSNMYFADQFEPRTIESPAVRAIVAARKVRMGLTSHSSVTGCRSITKDAGDGSPQAHQINPGDVVSIQPGGEGWSKSTSKAWYAYVQRLWLDARSNETKLDVIWLYNSTDTTLGKAKYLFENELFFSDHCDCGQDALSFGHIIDKMNVSWFATDPYAEKGLFVRRKFRTVAEDDTFDFIDLHLNDFRCKCDQKSSIYDEVQKMHSSGDTILYKQHGTDFLVVGQVIEFVSKEVRVRRLIRKSSIDRDVRPNELLETDDQITICPSACIRRCHVRYFKPGELPTPYDRNGAGDFYFIVKTDAEPNSVKFPELNQGWDPSESLPKRKLKGMGLFCGGGTFDRGLEEGGGIRFKYAIDYAERALHSYKANAKHEVHYFLGSVDDYLAHALAGRADSRIAQPGDIDILAAGSPCQGFSGLQVFKLSEDSRRNASRIASVVSFVDFYSPKYLVLENVVALTRNVGNEENVFSQLIAALVALGYQVQQFLMDSWLYSSPQRRSRVFIIASAPGLKPLEPPPISHGHPPHWKFRSAALGVSSSGKRFGVRHNHFTPFTHNSADQAVQDLPNIEDAQVQLCPQFPDHRTPTEEVAVSRDRILMVPVRPRGMGLIQARNKGLLRGEPLKWCAGVNEVRSVPNSKTYRRVDPRGLFPTILTKQSALDGKSGMVLHWSQHRVMTVMENRRAQGFPDHEVIVGTPSQQVEIIGNSVERNTALVLGLQVKDSWISSYSFKDSKIEVDDSLGQNAQI